MNVDRVILLLSVLSWYLAEGRISQSERHKITKALRAQAIARNEENLLLTDDGLVVQQRLAEGKPLPTKNVAGTVGVNCQKMFTPTRSLLKKKYIYWLPHFEVTNAQFASMSCTEIFEKFYFPDSPMSEEERNYPLAYVVMVHNDIYQTLKVLQSVYWPQNYYCFHVDSKASQSFRMAVERLVSCFDNILMEREPVSVYWAHVSVLNAALLCFRSLQQFSHDWKYIQILSATDIPLKTNREMVQILKTLNGSNDVEMQYHNFAGRFMLKWGFDVFLDGGRRRNKTHDFVFVQSFKYLYSDISKETVLPPHDVYPYKGSFASTLTHEFVDWIFNNSKAQDYLQFLQSTYVADEFFWSSLVHNIHLGAPGSFPGSCRHHYNAVLQAKPWISRDQVFLNDRDHNQRCASGYYTHTSCVYGLPDLRRLKTSHSLFAHKFYADYEPLAYHCMLELLYNRTYFGRKSDEPFQLDYFQTLPSVRYQNAPDKDDFVC